ncbi:AbrB family transcriptional regulator [Actinosynnema sp. ALI-1.44]|uniref:AbrB/MazE/SpoVT family DNA-binding domain-containing protein n=1 Tax=Actinosynnema sp. ALI-1.44 TaxID=1933779 RepID=UPI00097CAF89|nr:AbrB/MazE/SpoVT family DNA-binding domain-containing protein [Actinosynnema sp. ALI-1.44]ONI86521.1 AbrB family transcriptional regulator [Actinosynnema sp. ALI-1.44]
MRLNSNGQVTIPIELRRKYDLRAGDEVDVVDDGADLRIVRREGNPTRGRLLARRIRGKATTTLTTDELMGLLRAD